MGGTGRGDADNFRRIFVDFRDFTDLQVTLESGVSKGGFL